ncbi:WD40-repeat-containing domain protein [Spinellus fusiger]|nr:WD40-repeat-containing domain protein [Spinellus fusiger]
MQVSSLALNLHCFSTNSPTYCPSGTPPTANELLLAIFVHLDGTTLTQCSLVCRQWHAVIQHYDALIWSQCSQRDFGKGTLHRFWSLKFPDPRTYNAMRASLLPVTPSPPLPYLLKRTWQDMYRITRNWHTGYCQAYFPDTQTEPISGQWASCAVGYPKEASLFTNVTISQGGCIVKSNPLYHNPQGTLHSLILLHPTTGEHSYLKSTQDTERNQHSILCHYSHPSSPWLVTGSMHGSVGLWDVKTHQLVCMWHGHRGRVLCVSMNDKVAVSGGSDSAIHVWDLEERTTSVYTSKEGYGARRGRIDISSYLSSRGEWHQGVGEIAVNTHLVACALETQGSLLVFSLLTGSLVYELSTHFEDPQRWPVHEESVGLFKLCLTPFFLLTKGKMRKIDKSVPVNNTSTIIDTTMESNTPLAHRRGNRPTTQMTPYQIYQYYRANQTTPEHGIFMHCINVWSLQTGKLVYRLVPRLKDQASTYSITDIRVSCDFSKVLACIEVRGGLSTAPSPRSSIVEDRLYCWDFSTHYNWEKEPFAKTQWTAAQIESPSHGTSVIHKAGRLWMCYM